MLYADMIKVDSWTSLPTLLQSSPSSSEKMDEINTSIDELKELVLKLSSSSKTKTSTTLTDNEVGELLDMLIEFNETFFKDIPMTEKLSVSFIWNIPWKIYDASIKAKINNLPVYFNPMFWFYVMCLDEPTDMIAPYICEVMNNLNDDEDTIKQIEDLTNKYIDTYIDDEDSEDVYIDDNNLTKEENEDDRISSEAE